ncbi:MAG: LacI family DNA-binding transcriptional regulator [Flavobacteriaceae bacterium]
MKQKMTLKDIARELDVSISTVSKALKNSSEIGQDTKDKIQAFAKLYHYKPNNIAVSLKNKRTKNIGVIIPDILHYFFTTVFRGIEKYANQRGYNVIICISDESFDKEVINMEMLTNGSIDGFIMSLSAETQQKYDFAHLKEVTDQGIPLVLFDRVTEDIACDKVIINDFEIAYQAVGKFIKNGRKKIALVTTESYFNVSRKRAEGYRKALTDSGLRIDERLILRLPYSDVNVSEIGTFLLENEVDAILSVNELFAIHCMRLAKKMGIKIPADLEVIGFTDGILSRYGDPTLTTVDQYGDRMGEMAAQLLIDRIEEDGGEEAVEFRTEVIQATLIERESTVNDSTVHGKML